MDKSTTPRKEVKVTTTMKEELDFVRHKKDEFFDEIRIVTEGGAPSFRAVVRERYKTSGLSGDEWRFSNMWQICEPDHLWRDFDGGYCSFEVCMAALFPGIYKSHPNLHDVIVLQTEYWWKGHNLYTMTYDGKPLPLLAAAGHMPWAYIRAREGEYDTKTYEMLRSKLCFQPGCAEEAVSTYGLKKRYCEEGHETDATRKGFGANASKIIREAVRFCSQHLRRGDCALQDSDDNYIVLDGPGPDGHKMPASKESPSSFGGCVNININ